ncbi:hypothetical protein LS482_00055 [Sinomicrobium kalidii]|uniref:hypothetical protein n=1 Tax=Sinomicrobium kalidii TaxID=2900738 RepID=UPI001E653C42|nr:hypothetical protein [Sinomicrobium kalidii]UGU16276.1 hypothetical protein LS482_00055 [Sinomicrobium kalidii]
MIKYIIVFFICLLSCKDGQNDVSRKKELSENDSIVFKDSVNPNKKVKNTVELPYGSKEIRTYPFPESWTYPSVFSDNQSIDRNTKVLNDIVNSLQKSKTLRTNLFVQGVNDYNKYDEKLFDFLNKNSLTIEYNILEILPEKGGCNIVIRGYENLKKGAYIKDIVTINKKGKVIDYLNIYYSLSKDLHSSEKGFYIDKNYQIYIKSFEVYDSETRMMESTIYSIEHGRFKKIE